MDFARRDLLERGPDHRMAYVGSDMRYRRDTWRFMARKGGTN